MRPKILVITPIRHIKGVAGTLESAGDVTYMDDPSPEDVLKCIHDYHAIYTNPNKSNVFISKELMDTGSSLKVICTASTGTNHIDMGYAQSKGIPVLSITEEREVINRISSTAEHAFALMMASLRRLIPAWDSVKRGEWDYLPYIGRQLDHLTIGVVGYGRLGSLFADYCLAFKSRVLVYDPYKEVHRTELHQVELDQLLKESDAISIHVHVTPDTTGMVNRDWLAKAKHDVTLVNTSRGEICDEEALIAFLEQHPSAFYATDVLANETVNKSDNRLREWALRGEQVLITPHIGGMTLEAQQIAYNHATHLLKRFLNRHRVGES